MVSRIIFLGTAGDSFVAGKQIRASGGLIINVDENQLHIDPGPGALVRALENNVNLRENTAVLVSNNDIVNCNDVNAVIDAMTYGGLDKRGVLIANSTVVNGADGIKPYLTEKHAGFVEKIITVNSGQRLGVENIEINTLPTVSDDAVGIGFKISTNDFILGYTSNTKYSKDIAKEYRGCDILVLNVVLPADEKEGNQLNSADAIKFIREVNPQLAIITHFGIKMIKADPLYEGREIQKQTGVKVLVAKDGMSLTPDSYSAESRQKRLNMFKDQETGAIKKEEEKQDNSIVLEKPEEEHSEEKSTEESKEEKQEHLEF